MKLGDKSFTSSVTEAILDSGTTAIFFPSGDANVINKVSHFLLVFVVFSLHPKHEWLLLLNYQYISLHTEVRQFYGLVMAFALSTGLRPCCKKVAIPMISIDLGKKNAWLCWRKQMSLSLSWFQKLHEYINIMNVPIWSWCRFWSHCDKFIESSGINICFELQAIPTSVYWPEQDIWNVTCDYSRLPDLTFQLGGSEFALSPTLYVQVVRHSIHFCNCNSADRWTLKHIANQAIVVLVLLLCLGLPVTIISTRFACLLQMWRLLWYGIDCSKIARCNFATLMKRHCVSRKYIEIRRLPVLHQLKSAWVVHQIILSSLHSWLGWLDVRSAVTAGSSHLGSLTHMKKMIYKKHCLSSLSYELHFAALRLFESSKLKE